MQLVVCDGCGSTLHSEVGAKVGARLVMSAISDQSFRLARAADEAGAAQAAASILELTRARALTRIQMLASEMAGGGRGWIDIVKDYFYFTIVGALATETWTMLFALGDGISVLNGEVTRLGPFPGNQPPYLAYGIGDVAQGHLAVLRVVPTASVQSLLLGTDGAADLEGLADRTLPGQQEHVGKLDQFWTDDRYFKNPDALRRRLSLINREVKALDKSTGEMKTDYGLLRDDTTLVVMRRRKDTP